MRGKRERVPLNSSKLTFDSRDESTRAEKADPLLLPPPSSIKSRSAAGGAQLVPRKFSIISPRGNEVIAGLPVPDYTAFA